MSELSLCERSMVVFNFLPSRTLHPSRSGDYPSAAYVAALAAATESAPVWHRRWSQVILQQEGLEGDPVTDVGVEGLAIGVLRDDALAALVRRIGVVLCAPRLRYAISGDAVRALQLALGGDVLRWVRNGRALHPGLAGEMFLDADEALRNVTLAGCAALYIAFQGVRPQVARRFFLKLPALPQAPQSAQGEPDSANAGGVRLGGIDREVAAALDSDAAMTLATALHAGSMPREQG